jgi:hypothetical protein
MHMRNLAIGGVVLAAFVMLLSCVPTTGTGVERNAFFSFTDEFGTALLRDPNQDDTGTGADREVPEEEFRRPTALTFANIQPDMEVSFAWLAWVNPSSIRSRAQEDALYRGGYIRLDQQVEIGSAFRLPPGTFVFNGPGLAGATAVTLRRASTSAPADPNADGDQSAGDTGLTPTEQTISLVTPDVILVAAAPPRSCDSAAFVFTDDEELRSIPAHQLSSLAFAPSTQQIGNAPTDRTNTLGIHTLAQVSAYQCAPFRPGLFLRRGGGGRLPNEFFEGDAIRFEFRNFATDDGFFCLVEFTESP